MELDKLIEFFRQIHESEYKIWFTMEEIEKIIKKYKNKK